MVKNYWYIIEMSRNVQRNPLALKRFNQDLVLWRDSTGKLNCFEDRCSHRRTKLSLGKVIKDQLECCFHGATFNGDGRCTYMPACGRDAKISNKMSVKKFEVRESRGLIFFWHGESDHIDPKLPWFDELNDEQPYIDLSVDTPVGFCRMMENNLDFSHFYHLHKNYFTARKSLTYAKKFKSSIQGDRIEISGIFSTDTEKGREDDSGMPIQGTILFPGMALYESPLDTAQNPVLVVHSPITDNCTWFYSRHYLSKGALLPLRRFLKRWFIMELCWKHYVYQQDLRAWCNQSPMDSGASFDKLPAPSDIGIINYLKLWRMAQSETASIRVNSDPESRMSGEPNTFQLET